MARFFALILAVVFVACAACEAAQPLRFEPQQPKYITVTGPGEDVAAFVIRYQDALWPEWRKNEKYSREMFGNLRTIRRTGKAVVWCGDDKGKAAFTTASATLPIPGIDY
jgi:hypothetical protein